LDDEGPTVGGLQRLFRRMLNCPRCDTRDFTHCLGWPDSASRFQQDAADFIHMLICHIQKKLTHKAKFLGDLFWSEFADGNSS
jgi:hypothetical protein